MLSTGTLPYFAVVRRGHAAAHGAEDRRGENRARGSTDRPIRDLAHTLRLTVGAPEPEPSRERARIGHLARLRRRTRRLWPPPCRRATPKHRSAACAHHI